MHFERDQINTAVVLLGLSVLFVLGGYLPIRFESAGLDDRIDQARLTLGFETNHSNWVGKLASDVEDLDRAVHSSQRYVPQKNELANLLRQIGQQLSRYEISDQQIQTDTFVNGSNYSIIPIRLSFQGSFFDVYRFLQRIETIPRLIRIERLEIEADDPSQLGRLVNVEIKLSTFFSNPEGGRQN